MGQTTLAAMRLKTLNNNIQLYEVPLRGKNEMR